MGRAYAEGLSAKSKLEFHYVLQLNCVFEVLVAGFYIFNVVVLILT